jgi:DNA polymerase III sliding clamp (beta) subunit (PCNA family)
MRNVLIDGESQKISAISYDSYAESFCPIKDFNVSRGQLKATEKFCLQPKMLLDIVRTVDSETISLNAEKFDIISDEFHAQQVKIGDCFQEIPLHSIHKFSDGSIYGNLKKVGELEKDELRQISSAIQKESDIPYREYVQFDLDNDRLAAIDGKRFHIVHKDFKGSGKLLVLGELLQKMKSREWEVFVTPSKGFVVFRSGNLKIQAENDVKSVQYPNYEHRLTQKMDHGIEVPTSQFRHMVHQAALMSGKDYRAAEIEFGSQIDCNLKNPQKGCYNKTGMDIVGTVNPPVTITMDLKHLKDAIAGFGEATTTKIEVDQTEKFLRLSMGKFSSMVMKML